MKRFMMITVVLGGLIVATVSDARADHRSSKSGRSRFAISINSGNGFNNFGSSYSPGYQPQYGSYPVNGGGYHGGGYSGFGGYGSYGGYGGGIYGGGYGYGIYYPIFAVPIYVDGFNIGHQSSFGTHRHCR